MRRTTHQTKYCPRCNCAMANDKCTNSYGGCHYSGNGGRTRTQVIKDAEGYKLGDWQLPVGLGERE